MGLPHDPESSSVGATWPLICRNTQKKTEKIAIPASISPNRSYTSLGDVRPKRQHAKNATTVTTSDCTPFALYTGTLPLAVIVALNGFPGRYTCKSASNSAYAPSSCQARGDVLGHISGIKARPFLPNASAMALKEPSKFTNVCHLRTCANANGKRETAGSRVSRFKKGKTFGFVAVPRRRPRASASRGASNDSETGVDV